MKKSVHIAMLDHPDRLIPDHASSASVNTISVKAGKLTALTNDSNSSPLLNVEDARAAMLNRVDEINLVEEVTLDNMQGKILATDLTSALDLPGFDNSAMDGYAFKASTYCSQGLPIRQRIAAGDVAQPLPATAAARIFTGAMLPAGADTVVMQEHCTVRDGRLFVNQPINCGSHIRKKGHCVKKGQLVLGKGTRLQPHHIGLIAMLGIRRVWVKRPPRIALFTTGDELVEPGDAAEIGQVYNANLYSLSQLLIAHGCDIMYSATIKDDRNTTRETLKSASADVDIIVTSGGVSVGEEDHVKSAVEAEGELSLWKVRMKPGKPVAFGHLGSAHFIGLPGNPVSSYLTALLFLLPLIRKISGQKTSRNLNDYFPVPSGYAQLDFAWKTPAPRREFIRIQLKQQVDSLPWASAVSNQGSDVLTSLTSCDAIMEVPEFKTYQRGDILRFWTLNDLAF